MSRTATIFIAGITLTAPIDLVSAAGYEPYSDGTPSRSRQPLAEFRLMRALSERGRPDVVGGPHFNDDCIRILLRAVELAEIERIEYIKTDQLKLIAQAEARAAADGRAAAGMSLAATRIATGGK
jgi:hypothetical protein